MPRCCLPFEPDPVSAHAQPKHATRLALPTDKQLLASILSDAFQHDPVVRWILPSNEFDEKFFAIDTGYGYVGHQHCWLSADAGAAACWLPPGEKPQKAPLLESLRVFVPMLLKFGWVAAKRGNVVDQTFEHHRPQEPHYYLHMLGARLANQGQGLGSALLTKSLSVVDQQGMPAYLESSNESNVALYERFGFQVQHEARLAGEGPTVWFMWREKQ